jgi:hypothetical protein
MNHRRFLKRLIRTVVQKWHDRYEPSKHYMRGPGPATQTRMGRDTRRATSDATGPAQEERSPRGAQS